MPAIPGIHAALSGLIAASARVAVSADNIANAQNSAPVPKSAGGEAEQYDGYVPRRAVATSLAQGGTVAQPAAVDPAFVLAFDQGNPAADERGLVARPNVVPEAETADLIQAERAYEASLAALRTIDQLARALEESFARRER